MSASSRRAFGHEDDEDDFELGPQSHRSQREHLKGYSHGGAERRDPMESKKGPRIIPLSSSGSDWREDRKRRLGLGKYGDQARQQAASSHTASSWSADGAPERINGGKKKSGLQMPATLRDVIRTDVEEAARMAQLRAQAASSSATSRDKTPPAEMTMQACTPSPEEAEQNHLLSEDERARCALLVGQYGSSGLNSGRTISLHAMPLNEEEAFRKDASTRPDVPTLEDYAATPVEEFGKALLRGMGWKEGMGAGKGGKGPTTPAEVKKRSALLGLGATERLSALAGGGSNHASSWRGRSRRERGTSMQYHSGRSNPKSHYKLLIRKEAESTSRTSSASLYSHRDRSRSPQPRRQHHDSSRANSDGREAGRDEECLRSRSARRTYLDANSRYSRGYGDWDRERERERESDWNRNRDRERRHHRGDREARADVVADILARQGDARREQHR